MGALYTKELKRNRRNFLIWTAIVIGFTVMVLSIYPFMEGMGEDLSNMMQNIPNELRKAMGMDDQTWGSILGFYSTYFGIYIVLLAGIYTMSTGATILSKEEKERTAEFLMTRPISRKSIFQSKMTALLTLTLGIIVLQTIVAVISFSIASDDELAWATFSTMHIHGAVLIFFFTCIGVLLSMFLNPKTNFMGIVFGVIFGSYFLDAMSKATESTEWLGYFSAFHYVDFNLGNPDYSISIWGIVGLMVIGLLSVYYAFLRYNRRDIDD